MRAKHRKFYGFAALGFWLMLLGTASSADIGALDGGMLFILPTAALIGMIACARRAMG